MTGLSSTARISTSAALAALLAAFPLAATAELNVSVGASVGGGGANASVSLGGGGSGGGADASVSVGGGGSDGGSGGGADADVGVSIGGGSGGSGGTGGVDVGVDVSVGGAGGSGPGTAPGATPGTGGTALAGSGGSWDGVALANGMPAASLMGQVVWSSDGVALGVVSGIAGFDGSVMHLALLPNASLGLPARAVQVAMPMARLGGGDIRLSLTATEFVRVVSA